MTHHAILATIWLGMWAAAGLLFLKALFSDHGV